MRCAETVPGATFPGQQTINTLQWHPFPSPNRHIVYFAQLQNCVFHSARWLVSKWIKQKFTISDIAIQRKSNLKISSCASENNFVYFKVRKAQKRDQTFESNKSPICTPEYERKYIKTINPIPS
jgi:hypothetical protein